MDRRSPDLPDPTSNSSRSRRRSSISTLPFPKHHEATVLYRHRASKYTSPRDPFLPQTLLPYRFRVDSSSSSVEEQSPTVAQQSDFVSKARGGSLVPISAKRCRHNTCRLSIIDHRRWMYFFAPSSAMLLTSLDDARCYVCDHVIAGILGSNHAGVIR